MKKTLLAVGLALAAVVTLTSPARASSTVADDFATVNRDTKWTLAGKLALKFSTFHTEGMAVTRDRIFLSAVEITEATVKYPSPVNGYDRTPGKGVGHLFVLDRAGKLQKDIVLGEGDIYHPGGIDFDGRNVWVPVAEYRPNSATIVYRVDAGSLAVHKQFEVKDHFGGIVLDKTTGHLVGNTWGSRRFDEWTLSGTTLNSWDNTSFFIDYQDCQYVADAKALCGGVTNLPAAGRTDGTYELGGLALIDLRTHAVLREVPLQLWSSAGHVITRNPVKLASDGTTLTLRAAPDNGEEKNGTEIYTYTTAISARRAG